MSRWQILSYFRKHILIFALMALAPVIAHAQELGTATLTGDVSDPQGALVKDAKVTVQQSGRGIQRSTLTNAVGLFALNDLAPGEYEVQVQAAGFGAFMTRINLEVGQQGNVKARLSIASQKSAVDVNDTDALEQVNTVSSVVDGVVNAAQIENLPLMGAIFWSLHCSCLATPLRRTSIPLSPTQS